MNYKDKMNNEYDMLIGNINRMFVTDDLNELNNMFTFAIKRIVAIYDYKFKLMKGITDDEKILQYRKNKKD